MFYSDRNIVVACIERRTPRSPPSPDGPFCTAAIVLASYLPDRIRFHVTCAKPRLAFPSYVTFPARHLSSFSSPTTSPPHYRDNRTMSNPVPASLPAGPYVIRNRYNSAVVHIQHADATHQGIYSVQAYQQDEGQFKDQQIWWIEPLADFDTDSAKGVVYSISSPGSGKLLEGNPQSGIGRLGGVGTTDTDEMHAVGWAYSNKNCGGAWQRWRLRKVTDQTTKFVFLSAALLITNNMQ